MNKERDAMQEYEETKYPEKKWFEDEERVGDLDDNVYDKMFPERNDNDTFRYRKEK